MVEDRQYALLRDEANLSGLTMSELVRRAIDTTYRPNARWRVNGVELSVGYFRNPDEARVGRRINRGDRRYWPTPD